MEKNNCTIRELREKLDQLMDNQNISPVTDKILQENGIHFQLLDENKYNISPVYFLCKDGLCATEMLHHSEFGSYIFQRSLRKVEESELDKLAHEYVKFKSKIEKIEAVLDSQKIRGLFAKMKANE